MAQFQFFLYGINDDERVGYIEAFPGVENDFRLTEGLEMGEDFPGTVELSIDPSSGNIITDFIDNIKGILIVSERAKQAITDLGQPEAHIEFLPFILRNKHGRVVADRSYWVANLLRKVPCLAKDRSDFVATEDGSEIVVIETLFLDEEKIPDDASLFRVAEFPEQIVIRSDLVKAVEDAGLTGLCVMEQGEIR